MITSLEIAISENLVLNLHAGSVKLEVLFYNANGMAVRVKRDSFTEMVLVFQTSLCNCRCKVGLNGDEPACEKAALITGFKPEQDYLVFEMGFTVPAA